MDKQHAPRARAQAAGRRHVILLADLQYLAASQTAETRPPHERDGQHSVGQAWAQRCRETKGQDETGNGEKDVCDTHDQVINETAKIAGSGSQGDADAHRDDQHQDPNFQCDAGAQNHPREDIAPEVVGAKPMRCVRRFQPVGDMQRGRSIIRIGHKEWTDECHGHQKQDDHQANN